MAFKDWVFCLQNITFRYIFSFLEWALNERQCANGHIKAGMKKKKTFRTFWCIWRLVFERKMIFVVNNVIDCRMIHNAMRHLDKKYNLVDDTRANRPMSLSDFKKWMDIMIHTTKKAFKFGESRILAALFMLLLAPASSRPNSILKLTFGDLDIVLVRDPHGGPNRILIKFSLNFTKKYLDKKPTKTFYLPEIIYDPCFLLSPHVFLLGILFRYRAFQSEYLNDNPRKLSTLAIQDPSENDLILPLRKHLKDVPIFRQAVLTSSGNYKMSKNALSYATISGWIKDVRVLAGFAYTTICYSLRYSAGNNLDQSVNVSESLRNLVMDHAPSSDVLSKHYLGRHLCVDLNAIHRGQEPQQDLVRQATSLGHSRSDRRPKRLTDKEIGLFEHPSIIRLQPSLERHPVGSSEHQKARRKFNSEKYRLRRILKEKYRTEWTEKQAVKDIDMQIQGKLPEPAPTTSKGDSRPMTPAQQKLAQALIAPLFTDLQHQYQRRADAIDAIIEYCQAQEPLLTRVLEERTPDEPEELQTELSREEQLEDLQCSVIIGFPGEKLTRCFLCVGGALKMSPDDPNIKMKCRSYYSSRDNSRHFRNLHLARIGENEKTWCPTCETYLHNRKQLMNHAEAIHGINSEYFLVKANVGDA